MARKLYPAVFTRHKQIIFMSMNKFLVRNDPIVEPSYLFYTSDIINNAIIFIDRFNTRKETILNNIIENGLKDKIDHIELFKNIHSALHVNDFPKILAIKQSKHQNYQFVIDNFREKADDVFGIYLAVQSQKPQQNVRSVLKFFCSRIIIH